VNAMALKLYHTIWSAYQSHFGTFYIYCPSCKKRMMRRTKDKDNRLYDCKCGLSWELQI